MGWAYADEFMRQGHWVVICDVKDPAPAVAALKALADRGEVEGETVAEALTKWGINADKPNPVRV